MGRGSASSVSRHFVPRGHSTRSLRLIPPPACIPHCGRQALSPYARFVMRLHMITKDGICLCYPQFAMVIFSPSQSLVGKFPGSLDLHAACIRHRRRQHFVPVPQARFTITSTTITGISANGQQMEIGVKNPYLSAYFDISCLNTNPLCKWPANEIYPQIGM